MFAHTSLYNYLQKNNKLEEVLGTFMMPSEFYRYCSNNPKYKVDEEKYYKNRSELKEVLKALSKKNYISTPNELFK